jgi:hypothetical protein
MVTGIQSDPAGFETLENFSSYFIRYQNLN